MKITLCGSISVYKEMDRLTRELGDSGFEVEIPLSVKRILDSELTIEEFNRELDSGKGHQRKIIDDAIKRHFEKIKNSDAILVVNVKKNDKENYIGGNTFLEIGFAHVLDKKIFLLNPIPEHVSYLDEIKAMQPVIVNGNLNKIK